MSSHFQEARTAGCLIAACILSVGIAAQSQQPPPKAVPKVKSVAAPPIVSVEGEDNFIAYCAVCHGNSGKGDGPAAPAMKMPVPDLTTIAKRNKGRFSAVDVEAIILGSGKTRTPAHGVEDMPIWGDVFRHEDPVKRKLRIGNLVKYLESIQVPAAASARR
jgi:mono/diheme cytochrome c family protein